ncbi:MAG: hypothetical protein AAGI68_16425 [Planctomycetota bacterium]
MKRNDVLVLIVIGCLLAIGAMIILPSLRESQVRRTPRHLVNQTQLRGIHQAMVIYAQGNKDYFPGLDSSGAVVASAVSERFALLLDANSFTPEYLINPVEASMAEALDVGSGYVVTPANHSYAGLELRTPGGRVNAWSVTMSYEEAVLSDRNTGVDATANVQSVWTAAPGDWQGSVLRNDNSTMFKKTHVVETAYTEPSSVPATTPGTRREHTSDNLFEAAGAHDAWLVHD